ncbi:hypothetical protein EVAR_84707_1 [Eumeta japonica]|uniref:Uncharacterized protein n=1 Tax=Eumeta variegata TaxID=151549 RepID=A0A4C1VU50_EUMVA|nr:hypothetical protein EVAR_84707_1 [Eumeta japonica]
MNDDELISCRKKQNADRVRAYRKRKKNLDAMPSTGNVQSDVLAERSYVRDPRATSSGPGSMAERDSFNLPNDLFRALTRVKQAHELSENTWSPPPVDIRDSSTNRIGNETPRRRRRTVELIINKQIATHALAITGARASKTS